MGACMNSILEAVIVVSVLSYTMILVVVLACWKPRTLLARSPRPNLEIGLTVVIAARNESATLEAGLRSLLSQAGVRRVIVVDDHSTDDTKAIVESIAIEDSRVCCLPAPALPPDWIGKSHALHFGANQVETPFLLFTDADVVFGPGVLATAVDHMHANRLDHLGGHFFIDCRSVAEEICAPVLALSSALVLFGTANTQGASTGAFNLVSTAFYRSSGGHEPVKCAIVDDVALARHLKAMGANSSFVAMREHLKVRLFVGFKGFTDAVARSAVPFLQWGGGIACGVAVLCMALALLPVASVLATTVLLLALPSDAQNTFPLYAGLLPLLIGLCLTSLSRPFHNARARFQICFPVALFLMAASVFRAAAAKLRGRPVTWRGRVYSTCARKLTVPSFDNRQPETAPWKL